MNPVFAKDNPPKTKHPDLPERRASIEMNRHTKLEITWSIRQYLRRLVEQRGATRDDGLVHSGMSPNFKA